MSLNVGEGVRRIALAIRFVGYCVALMAAGGSVTAGFSGEGWESVVFLLALAAFAWGVGNGIAWIVEGFAKTR